MCIALLHISKRNLSLLLLSLFTSFQQLCCLDTVALTIVEHRRVLTLSVVEMQHKYDRKVDLDLVSLYFYISMSLNRDCIYSCSVRQKDTLTKAQRRTLRHIKQWYDQWDFQCKITLGYFRCRITVNEHLFRSVQNPEVQ